MITIKFLLNSYKNSISYLNKVFYIIGKHKKSVPFVILLFFLGALSDLFGISLLIPFISISFNLSSHEFLNVEKIENIGIEPIYTIGFLIILIFSFKFVIALAIKYKIVRFCYDIQVSIKERLMSNYSNLDYTKFVNRDSSEYVFNVVNLTGRFSNAVVQTLLQSVSNILVALSIGLVLFISDPLFFFILSLIFTLFVFLYDIIFGNLMKKYGMIANISSTNKIKAVNEAFHGFKQNYAYDSFGFFSQTIKKEAIRLSLSQSLKETISIIPRYAIETFFALIVVLFIWYLLWVELDPVNYLPQITLYCFAAIRLIPIANSFTSMFSLFRYGKHSVETLYHDLSKKTENESLDNFSGSDNLTLYSSCSFENVSFMYPNSNDFVFENINLSFEKGNIIGIVGPSGSGKTTIVDLILGLIQPTHGTIIYDNERNPVPKQIISSISYQPQDPFVINSTIKNNIALGEDHDHIDMKKLMLSLKLANLNEFISSLSDGLDSKIGQFGAKLSGGQRQRIALARAFYFERKIMIFDESTSSLDDDSEKKIMDDLISLKGKVTIIFITHNLNNCKYFDKTYRIKKGEITTIKNEKKR